MERLRIHCIQHVRFEGIGCIKDWVKSNRHSISHTKLYQKSDFPAMDSFDWLIIMGGPMSVNDTEEYTWLTPEKNFIKKAIEQNKTILGICLGAQLIANALEANVYKNDEKEIGWFPIQISETKPNPLIDLISKNNKVFHWHGETFETPKNAIHLAGSKACKNQAFLYKTNVIGLQFHLELTKKDVLEMLHHGKNELINITGYVQSELEIISNEAYYQANKQILYTLLDFLESKTLELD